MLRVAGDGQLHLLYKTRFCTEIESCHVIPILAEETSMETDVCNESPAHHFNKLQSQVEKLKRYKNIVERWK